jgi:tetratricopeptide (TPR) repeat protein
LPLAIVWSLGLMSLGHSADSVLRRLGSGSDDIAAFCFVRSVEALGDGDARQVLAAASLFEEPVTRDLLGRSAGLGDDVIGRDDALQTLIQLSLINHRGDSFSLLPLTRTFMHRFLADRPNLRRTAEVAWFAELMRIASDYRESDLMWRDRARLRSVGPHMERAYAFLLAHGHTGSFIVAARALMAYYDVVGRWDDLVEIANELETFGRATGDADAISDAIWTLSWVHGQRGQFAEARAGLERARVAATTPIHRINYLVVSAQTGRRAGQLKAAAGHLAEAMAILPELDSAVAAPYRANILYERGKVARDAGDLEEAERSLTEAGQVFDLDDAEDAIAAGRRPAYSSEWALTLLGNRAVVEHRRGNLATAAAMLERSLRFTREHGSVSNIASILMRLAWVRIDQGRLDDARAAAREARPLAAQTGMRDELEQAGRILADHPAD